MVKTTIPEFLFTNILCVLFVFFPNIGSTFSGENEKENITVQSSSLPFISEQAFDNVTARFGGEYFKFNIGFWIFKKMGIATLQCVRGDNEITVTLDAYTTGMIDGVLHRHNTYKTTMTLDIDTNRLRPQDTYEKKIKGKRERIKITNNDYGNGIRNYKIVKDGMPRRENQIVLDGKGNDDGISAFYNLRNETYGEVKEGARFTICTTYRDSSTDSEVYVRLPERSDKLSKWDNKAVNARYAVDINMDPEIFDSKDGKLVILFTDDLRPVGFVAKDVIGFGDLYGVLEDEVN